MTYVHIRPIARRLQTDEVADFKKKTLKKTLNK